MVMDSDPDEWCWDDLSLDAVFLIAVFVQEFDVTWFKDVSMFAWSAIEFHRPDATDVPIRPHERLRVKEDWFNPVNMIWDDMVLMCIAGVRLGFMTVAVDVKRIHEDAMRYHVDWELPANKVENVTSLYAECIRNAAHAQRCRLLRPLTRYRSTKNRVWHAYDYECIAEGYAMGGHIDELVRFDRECERMMHISVDAPDREDLMEIYLCARKCAMVRRQFQAVRWLNRKLDSLHMLAWGTVWQQHENDSE